MPKLIGIDRAAFYSWVLTPGRQVIGRGADCDFYVPDTTVSRKHAELEVSSSGGGLYITTNITNQQQKTAVGKQGEIVHIPSIGFR